MKNILLINQGKIPHYRVPVYNYLNNYLRKYQFNLTIVAEGVQEGNSHNTCYVFRNIHLSFMSLKRLFVDERPDAVIFWVGPHPYIFPVLILANFLKIKVIHWGHRRPMPPTIFNTFIKNFVYNFEHWMDDGVILYAEQLKKYVWKRFQSKVFIANNTLNLTMYKTFPRPKEDVKAKYGIFTYKNIICMGRMQQRKRVGDLIQAFSMLDMEDVGLILAGPDSEEILKGIQGRNIFKFGPVYGEESLELLSAADVYCLPGAIGLGIVDAFYCGLPVITEDVIHGPEIMYLKDGINGCLVPKGDIKQLAARLRMLLTDDTLRERFSRAARNEIMTTGHIDRMCEGFVNALQYVCK
jgi:glycosyltransferase involved in cell wall biosynthesis